MTKHEFADLRNSMLHYARHVETMRECFSESALPWKTACPTSCGTSTNCERVDSLEKRVPPEAV